MSNEELRLTRRFIIAGKECSDFPGWGKNAKVWCACGRHRFDVLMLDGTQELRCPVTGALTRFDIGYDAVSLESRISVAERG